MNDTLNDNSPTLFAETGINTKSKQVQKLYAVIGACFLPLLALALLLLNGRTALVGAARNRWASWVVLLATMGFFGFLLVRKVTGLVS